MFPQLETQLRQQARLALLKGRGHAFVMQSGNCMALEIGNRHELQARLRHWLPVIEASQGEDVSLLIEAWSVISVLMLREVGFTVKVFTTEPTERLGVRNGN